MPLYPDKPAGTRNLLLQFLPVKPEKRSQSGGGGGGVFYPGEFTVKGKTIRAGGQYISPAIKNGAPAGRNSPCLPVLILSLGGITPVVNTLQEKEAPDKNESTAQQ